MRMVYMDTSATTPVRKEVLEAMIPYFDEVYGNPSSLHRFGQQARAALEDARTRFASLIGAEPEEIVFTSGGTESDNLAIKGVALALREKKNRIVTSSVEHHAVLRTCESLEREGFEVIYLGVDKYGRVDPDDVRKAVDEKTALVTVMTANNEVGTIQPIREIAKITRQRDLFFHTDAVQALGKTNFSVKDCGVDSASFSSHKIYGPKGVGALYIRKGIKLTPLAHGGHHERRRRAGTENLPGIIGFVRAAELAVAELPRFQKEMRRLRDMLQSRIEEHIPHIRVNGHPDERLPNLLNISFEYIEGESLLMSLDMEGIAVTSGSACTSASLEPSHVLKAMGVPPATAQGSVRFSLGWMNTEEDIEYVVEKLKEIVPRLRKMSPLWE